MRRCPRCGQESEGSVLTGIYRCPTHQRWHKPPFSKPRFFDVDYRPVPDDYPTILAILALYTLALIFEIAFFGVFIAGIVTNSLRTSVVAFIVGLIGFCFGVTAERLR